MRRRKGEGFNGLLPLEWTDIDAFCKRAFPLTDWEIRIIEKLDDFWLTRPEVNPVAPVEPVVDGYKKPDKGQERTMTGKLFDAIFGGAKR